jgi:hypothetical protein
MEVEKEPKKPKQIQEFAYSPQGRKERTRYFVLAWTKKEALELFEAVGVRLTLNELNNFTYAWGTDGKAFLKDVDQSKSAVYLAELLEGGNNINKAVAPKKLK